MTYTMAMQPQRLLHDIVDSPDLPADVLAKAGDCFITIATQLDAILHMPTVGKEAHPQLDQLVRQLTYLQRHYKVVKLDQPDYRQ